MVTEVKSVSFVARLAIVWYTGRPKAYQPLSPSFLWRKRWEDSIREWTGLEFAKSQRAVENMEKWRKLVLKSSVVTQRPSRLLGR